MPKHLAYEALTIVLQHWILPTGGVNDQKQPGERLTTNAAGHPSLNIQTILNRLEAITIDDDRDYQVITVSITFRFTFLHDQFLSIEITST